MSIRLVLYGHTGSGKSTSAQMVKRYFEDRGYTVAVLKLAQPLYELQQQFYKIAEKNIAFSDQDQILLEAIATHLRRISPTSLADNFLRRLQITDADVILNDDLRDPHIDYPALKQCNFKFLRITCQEGVRLQRLQQRNDVSTNIHSTTTAQLDRIEPDYLIDNSINDLGHLRATIHAILDEIVNSDVLEFATLPTNQIS